MPRRPINDVVNDCRTFLDGLEFDYELNGQLVHHKPGGTAYFELYDVDDHRWHYYEVSVDAYRNGDYNQPV